MTQRSHASNIARMSALSLCLGLIGCGDDGTTISASAPTTDATTTDQTTTDPGTTTTGVTTEAPTTGAPTTGSTTDDDTTTSSTTAVTVTDGTTGTTADDTTGTTADDTTGTSTGAPETCEDGVLNQDETDIDCGGATCSPCALGQTCLAHPDCIEGACIDGVCSMVECLLDADCDAQDGECVEGLCDLQTFLCTTTPSNEAGPCDDGDLCSVSSACAAGACVAAEPVDCSALDSACTIGTCNPEDGQCQLVELPDGQACDDGNACTLASTCLASVCGDPNDPGYLFYEDFADNDAGWTLSPNWAIGAAVEGCGDPGADHTATDDNGIAGAVLGGCVPTAPVDANTFFCLTSPAVDTTGLATVALGYWRDLYSDYTPYMKNKVEVWDGAAWNIVYETFGSPAVNDLAWTKLDHDITAHSNAALQVRWCYNIGSAGAFARGSWNVDDVVIAEAPCDP